MAPWALA
jgi:hypothetical protein